MTRPVKVTTREFWSAARRSAEIDMGPPPPPKGDSAARAASGTQRARAKRVKRAAGRASKGARERAGVLARALTFMFMGFSKLAR
jgi:hypothetical protein